MEGFEDLLDWEGLREYIEPIAGLLIALAFMAFVRLLKGMQRRRSPQTSVDPKRFQIEAPKLDSRQARGAKPIQPGDDAARMSSDFSQKPRE